MAKTKNEIRYVEVCKPSFERIENGLEDIKKQVYNHLPTKINRLSALIITIQGTMIGVLLMIFFTKLI